MVLQVGRAVNGDERKRQEPETNLTALFGQVVHRAAPHRAQTNDDGIVAAREAKLLDLRC